MTVHPAALVLADHKVVMRDDPASPARCVCGWTGQSCDGPAHLAEVLDRAGLLAAETTPETPTTRVLDERADRRTT